MARARRKAPARSSRLASSRVSYRELSTDESMDEQTSEDDEEEAKQPVPRIPAPKRQRIHAPAASPSKPRNTRSVNSSTSSTQPKQSFAKKRRPSSGRPRTSHPPTTLQRHIPTDGVIPDWTSLPYETLFLIFQYASHPLRNDILRHTAGRSWLYNTAQICRSFCEPALAVLYMNPPLDDRSEAFHLLDLVSQEQDKLCINYRTKVKRLELMVRDTLMYTMPGRGLFDVSTLVPYLPQLKEIYVKDIGDQPPFRVFSVPRTGHLHLTQVWSTLSADSSKLRGTRWNGLMMAEDNGASATGASRLSGGAAEWFQGIRHLELARMQLQKSTDNIRGTPEPDPTTDTSGELVSVLRQLPSLESLSLESCFHMSWAFLTELPVTLKSIKITNTAWLSSDAILAFMHSRGSILEHLDVSHNQYLDLGFLVSLRELCPNLRTLRMDARYFSAVVLNKDTEPLYDNLLLAEDVPSWPTALESIELSNLRKWDLEAGEVFFASLIRAAPQLPNLRHIFIRAMLSIGWRDRAGFRDKYLGALDRVFKRRSAAPNPHLASYRAHRLYKEAVEKRSTIASVEEPLLEAVIPVSTDGKALRRSSRAKINQTESDSDSSTRGGRGSGVGPEDDEFADVQVQGLCEVVDVNVDNLRPAEVLFDEADFIDSELSGDEDWTADGEQ